jgi:hypothetical protein
MLVIYTIDLKCICQYRAAGHAARCWPLLRGQPTDTAKVVPCRNRVTIFNCRVDSMWTRVPSRKEGIVLYTIQANYINALAVSVLRSLEPAGPITLGELYFTFSELVFTFHLTTFNVMFRSKYF